MFSSVGKFFKRNSEEDNNTNYRNDDVPNIVDYDVPNIVPTSSSHSHEEEPNQYEIQQLQEEIRRLKHHEENRCTQEDAQRKKLEQIMANLDIHDAKKEQNEDSVTVDEMINSLYQVLVEQNQKSKEKTMERKSRIKFECEDQVVSKEKVKPEKKEEKKLVRVKYVSKQHVLVVAGTHAGKFGNIQEALDGRAKIAIGVDVIMDNQTKKGYWMPISFLTPNDHNKEEISCVRLQIMSSKCKPLTDLGSLTAEQQISLLMTHQHHILPFLHLGDYESFQQVGKGNPQNFSVVVKATHQSHINPENPFYLNSELPENIILYDIGSGLHDVDDRWSTHFGSALDKVLPKIQEHRQARQRVLVHCTQGQSRAPTVVIAYLMWQYNVPYEKAFAFVQSKRYQIKPKDGFVQGLKAKYSSFQS